MTIGGTPQHILVYGLGRSGLAVATLADRQGHQIRWFDQDQDGPTAQEAIARGWPLEAQPALAHVDVCIAAPGVRWDHPDLVTLRERGTEVIGEIEWVARTTSVPMIGVTGTAGKGTVTRWTEAMLKSASIPASAGGNLDPALSALVHDDLTPKHWFVVEVSSFQLERSPTLHPRVAVITRLGRDHLDRHGDVAHYHAIKRRLLENLTENDVAVLNADDPVQASWFDTAATVHGYSASGEHAAAATIRHGRIVVHEHDLGPIDQLTPQGQHQRENLLAACLAAYAAGATPEAIQRCIPTLDVAAHRHELIAERCGVRFVNDSVASRELAVRAALEAATPPIAWIVGGRDKGSTPEALRDMIPGRVHHMYGIGEAGAAFTSAWSDLAPATVNREPSGREALRQVVREAATMLRDAGGGTVLLAPLAASFDQFKGYEDRGNTFREVVHDLLEEDAWTAC